MAESWRSGFNRSAHDLETRLTSLVQATLDTKGLTIVSTDNGRGLVPLRGLREGDTICDVHTLWYDSMAGLEEAAGWDGRATRVINNAFSVHADCSGWSAELYIVISYHKGKDSAISIRLSPTLTL